MVRPCGMAVLGLVIFVTPMATAGGRGLPSGWPRVYIADPYTRDAARRSLDGASARLLVSKCQSVLWEFRAVNGRPLAEKLEALGMTPVEYLRLIVFEDSGDRSACRQPGILAFTTPESRLVYLCGRDFERASRRDPAQAQISLIHEMMHSLGLGENPPTAGYITARVQELCWHER